jgi:hypothetical protein
MKAIFVLALLVVVSLAEVEKITEVQLIAPGKPRPKNDIAIDGEPKTNKQRRKIFENSKKRKFRFYPKKKKEAHPHPHLHLHLHHFPRPDCHRQGSVGYHQGGQAGGEL